MVFIILAAGKGVRAESASFNLPKVLLPGIDGKSLLINTMEKIVNVSIHKNLNIVVGFMYEKIIEGVKHFIDTNKEFNIQIILNKDYDRGVLTSLYKGIENVDDDIVILNGDTYYSDQVFELFNQMTKTTLLVMPYQDVPDAVKVITKDSHVMQVGKDLMNATYNSIGCIFLQKNHVNILKRQLGNILRENNFEKMIWHNLLNLLIENGEEIYFYLTRHNTNFEIDTRDDYKRFLRQYSNHE